MTIEVEAFRLGYAREDEQAKSELRKLDEYELKLLYAGLQNFGHIVCDLFKELNIEPWE